MMMEDLRELVFELDCELGSIGCNVETLADIKDLLLHLRDNFDTAVYRGEEKYYFHELHQQIRILSELTRFTMNELCEEYEKTVGLKDKLFEMVVTKGEAPDALAATTLV